MIRALSLSVSVLAREITLIPIHIGNNVSLLIGSIILYSTTAPLKISLARERKYISSRNVSDVHVIYIAFADFIAHDVDILFSRARDGRDRIKAKKRGEGRPLESKSSRALPLLPKRGETTGCLERSRESAIGDTRRGTKCKITVCEYHSILPSFLAIYPIKAAPPPASTYPFCVRSRDAPSLKNVSCPL